MLTINERRWLVQRKGYCDWCSVKFKTDNCFWVISADLCPLYPRQVSIQDSAEFSERVAARLARMMLRPNEYKYPCKYPCPNGVPELGCMCDMTALTGSYAVHCVDCILREVRLQVEEEMDADI